MTRLARIACAGSLAICGVLGASGVAVADDPPPPPGPNTAPLLLMPPQPVVPAPPASTIGLPLAQAGIEGGPAGLPDLFQTGNAFLLGQAPVPSAPNTAVGIPPSLNAFTNDYLVPINDVPSTPGQGTLYGVPEGEQAAPGFFAYLGRVHQAAVDGRLRGGLLGQYPQWQLGEPLPGTAPAPGIQVPPGLNPQSRPRRHPPAEQARARATVRSARS